MSNTVQRRRTGQSAEFADVSADVYFDNSEKSIYGKAFAETDQDYVQVYSDKVNSLQVVDSTKDGAGTIRPLSFQMGSVEKMRLGTTGLLSVPNGVTISGGGSLTVSGGGQVNTNTISVLIATNTMSFVSTGGAFTFDGPISMTTSTGLFVDSTDGTAAAVAPANHGRIIYNNTTKTWQISADTGAYASIATGAGSGNTLTQSYNQGGAGAGKVITVDAGAVAFTGSGTPATPGHMLVNGSQTIASAAGATWKAASFAPGVTLSGNTHITTATGFNMVEFAIPTLSAASAMTCDIAATVTILGAPVGGGAGPLTLTTGYALWVQAGSSAFPVGSATVPSLTFSGDKTTGIFSIAAGAISFTNVGVRRTKFSDVGYIFNETNGLPNNFAILSSASGVNLFRSNFSTDTIGMGNSGTTNTFLSIADVVRTTGSGGVLLVTGAAHTTLTAGAEAVNVNFNLAQTVQFATGAIATQRTFLIQAATYGFVGASTITNAATFAITGAPATGTNATITNSYSLWVQAGRGLFDGGLLVGAEPTGVAGKVAFTNTVDNSANSTGVGTILFKGATSRNSSGFLKVLDGTTARFIPYFDAITG